MTRAASFAIEGQHVARPAAPDRIVRRDAQDHVAVDENGRHQPRVSADPTSIIIGGRNTPPRHIGPLGARGIGELGALGIGPAIANAVFHATGIRVREVPIRPEHLLRTTSDS